MIHKLRDHSGQVALLMRLAFAVNIVTLGLLSLGLILLRRQVEGLFQAGAAYTYTLWSMLAVGVVLVIRPTLCGALAALGRMKLVFFSTMIASRTALVCSVALLLLLAKQQIVPAHPMVLVLGAGLAEFCIVLWLLVASSNLWYRAINESESKRATFLLSTLTGGALPILFHNTCGFVNEHLSKLLMGIWGANVAAVGILHVAGMCAALIHLPFSMFNRSYAPLASRLYRLRQIDQLRRLYRESAFITTAAALSIAALITFWGETLLKVYGDDYSQGYVPLLFLAVAAVVWVITGPCGYTLMMMEKVQVFWVTTPLSLFVNIVLSLLLIPRFGMLGAAWAVMGGNLVRNACLALYLYHLSRIHAFGAAFFRLIFGVMVLILLFWFGRITVGHTVAAGMATLILALSLFLLLRSRLLEVLGLLLRHRATVPQIRPDS